MNRLFKVALHIGYWGMYTLLLAILFLLTNITTKDSSPSLAEGFRMWFRAMIPLAFVPGIIGFYGSYSLLFSRFFLRKKIGKFLALSLLIILASSLIALPIVYMLIPLPKNISWYDLLGMATVMMLMATINLIIGTIIKGFITSYTDIQVKEELTQHSTQLELALVKSQISPHFLFNTLNNIDVLIQRDPKQASSYLIKLSEILRFMLYEAKDEPIPLSRELQHIYQYIDLQRIRTTIPNYITLHVEGPLENVRVQPMLFMPFIENAYKYAEQKKGPEAIRMAWRITEEEVFFSCDNAYDSTSKNENSKQEGGLGNELIRKRLQLLYPHQHRLHIEEKNDRYYVSLYLQRL